MTLFFSAFLNPAVRVLAAVPSQATPAPESDAAAPDPLGPVPLPEGVLASIEDGPEPQPPFITVAYANAEQHRELTSMRAVRSLAARRLAESRVAAAAARAYVRKWGRKLDRYLAGSPLAGHGDDFARSAYRHGIDPRLSAAIALKESGLGRHNAGVHNAWGVRSGRGWRSWGSWEAAIEGHAALIARYGKHSTPESMARKYCPPTWQEWARSVRGQMSRIG